MYKSKNQISSCLIFFSFNTLKVKAPRCEVLRLNNLRDTKPRFQLLNDTTGNPSFLYGDGSLPPGHWISVRSFSCVNQCWWRISYFLQYLNYFLVYIWKDLLSEKCYHMRLQTRRVSLWHERKDPAGGVWLRGNTALPLEATLRSLVLQSIGISLLSYFSAIYAFMAAKYLNSSCAYHVEFYQRQTISSFQWYFPLKPQFQASPSPLSREDDLKSIEKQINGYWRRIDSENFILSRFQSSLVELQIIVVPVELTNLIIV